MNMKDDRDILPETILKDGAIVIEVNDLETNKTYLIVETSPGLYCILHSIDKVIH
jgi:hypothetical protein